MSETLGEHLRAAREARGCTLEEAERATRIRARHLAALEADDYSTLPSMTQVRGFLRNYAQFLGLDPEPLLAHQAEKSNRKARLPLAASTGRRAPRPATASPVQARPRRLRLFSPDVLVAGLVTLGLGLLLVWGGAQFMAQSAAGQTPAASGAVAAGGTPTAAATPTPADAALSDASPTAPLPPPQATYVGVNLTVRAEQRLWLRVVVDGAEAFAGLMRPGESKDFVGQSVVELVTGNARGTRVIWNGRDQGALGNLGEVVDRLWTQGGMIIPTATVTPTPSATRRPTATPVPSRTPRP